MGLSFRRPRKDRLFHYITSAVVFVAAIAYFSMGSNLGFTPIQVEYPRSDPKVHGQYREIFYVRYIDWFITTPLLLLDLMLTAGMPWPTILFIILVDEIMIITGLVGALVVSVYKWGYFAFGMLPLLLLDSTLMLMWSRLLRTRLHRLPSRLGITPPRRAPRRRGLPLLLPVWLADSRPLDHLSNCMGCLRGW
jgi:bacteriorhodopsin